MALGAFVTVRTKLTDTQYLSVVMPAFNEEATVREIIERVMQLDCLLELIVVDDCSTDNTPAILKELEEKYPQLTCITQKKNGGKTRALAAGFTLTKGDIVIVQDADLEYDPSEIPEVILPIANGQADVVFGSRFMIRRAARVLYFHHYLANKWLTFFSNVLTNFNMSDIETCYKAFRGEIIRNMTIDSYGFGFEIEVTAKVAKLGCSVYEVPVSYYGRTYEEGKKIGFKDGLAALLYIIKYNLFTNRSSSFKSLPENLLRNDDSRNATLND